VREQRLGAPATPPAAFQFKVDSRPDNKINFTYTGGLGLFRLDDATPDDGDAFTAERFFTRAAGAYQVTQQAVNGWYLKETRCQTPGAAEQVQPPGPLNLTATAGAFVACTFVNERTATVRILAYDDRNRSGRRNNNESWLEGATVELEDLSTGVRTTQTTNNLGKASFVNLKPGAYQICAVVTPPWYNTQPGFSQELGGPCYWLAAGAGQIQTVYFGNTTLPATQSIAAAPAADSVMTTMAADEQNDEGMSPTLEESWLLTSEAEEGNTLFMPLIVR
jgi:hypothetical protein